MYIKSFNTLFKNNWRVISLADHFQWEEERKREGKLNYSCSNTKTKRTTASWPKFLLEWNWSFKVLKASGIFTVKFPFFWVGHYLFVNKVYQPFIYAESEEGAYLSERNPAHGETKWPMPDKAKSPSVW